MDALKSERMREAIKHAAAEFLARESNRQSLITVTDVTLKERGQRAIILCTVLPEEIEQSALAFLKRQRGALRAHIAEHVRMQRLPIIDCALDPVRNLYTMNLNGSGDIGNTKI